MTTAKMTIGVPIVTGLPRLYKQCNNSLPIVNKNLAIALEALRNELYKFKTYLLKYLLSQTDGASAAHTIGRGHT